MLAAMAWLKFMLAVNYWVKFSHHQVGLGDLPMLAQPWLMGSILSSHVELGQMV